MNEWISYDELIEESDSRSDEEVAVAEVVGLSDTIIVKWFSLLIVFYVRCGQIGEATTSHNFFN